MLLAIALGLMIVWYGPDAWRGEATRAIDQATSRVPRFEVDLNTAPWPELAQLPGIGETVARRIVERRTQHGPFESIEQLREVSGIGAKTLDKIRPWIVAGPVDATSTSSAGPR